METFLVTGGAGFFGSILVRELLAQGHAVVSFDKRRQTMRAPRLTVIEGDLADAPLVAEAFQGRAYRGVFHCAAALGHSIPSKAELWRTNVTATAALYAQAKASGVPHFVFLSTNCLWGTYPGRPVREDDPPHPIEIYGRSKAKAEEELFQAAEGSPTRVVVLRCPTIMDQGRLGLFTLLFDLVRENRVLWMIGDGSHRYQFVYAQDLVNACLLSLNAERSRKYNLGSTPVPTLREVYDGLIQAARSGSEVRAFPRLPGWLLLRAAYAAGLSPLGPYHAKMIANDFQFDTTRIREELGWRATLTNTEMLVKAYRHYVGSYGRLQSELADPAHVGSVRWGALRAVRWVSWRVPG